MAEYKILLRLFVETGDIVEARHVADAIKMRVEKYSEASLHKIEPYWKIPTYYEITLNLQPAIDSKLAFAGIMNQLGSGWEYHDTSETANFTQWAVWVSPHSGTFFLPNVRWANIELF